MSTEHYDVIHADPGVQLAWDADTRTLNVTGTGRCELGTVRGTLVSAGVDVTAQTVERDAECEGGTQHCQTVERDAWCKGGTQHCGIVKEDAWCKGGTQHCGTVERDAECQGGTQHCQKVKEDARCYGGEQHCGTVERNAICRGGKQECQQVGRSAWCVEGTQHCGAVEQDAFSGKPQQLYPAISHRILELEYHLTNIDELEGFESEVASLQPELAHLSDLLADIDPCEGDCSQDCAGVEGDARCEGGVQHCGTVNGWALCGGGTQHCETVGRDVFCKGGEQTIGEQADAEEGVKI